MHMALFKVVLVESAAAWHDSLPADTAGNWAQLKTAFETRYNPPGFMKYQHTKYLFHMKQSDTSVGDFYAKMQRLAKDVSADEHMLRFAVINGLNPEIRNHVTRSQPTTWTYLIYHAKVGEMCVPVPSQTEATVTIKLELIEDQLKQLTAEKQTRPIPPVIAVVIP